MIANDRYETDAQYKQEAARLEIDLAYQALESSDWQAARTHFYNALVRLDDLGTENEEGALAIAAALELSNLSFTQGRGFGELVTFLKSAQQTAERMGDRRSQAMIHLHLGRLYYFSGHREDAMRMFEQGKVEVEELGDDDIYTQSAEFLGLYYHIQGFFREASVFFERALESFESAHRTSVVNPSAPIWLGYCSAYLGHFHRAIGTLDYYRRFCLERGDRALAATIRAVLGIVLLELKKAKEAAFHLTGALKEATLTHNALAQYFARGGLAYYHFVEGQLEQCAQFVSMALEEGAASGLVRQYTSPILLEMAFELNSKGIFPKSQMNMEAEFLRILNDPNIHLRGVLYRITATVKHAFGMDSAAVKEDLERSAAYLERAGTPVQLAKTHFEMVRILLQEGDYQGARRLANQAWKKMAGYGPEFYPDDLRHLLATDKETPVDRGGSSEEFMLHFMDMLQDLMPDSEPDVQLTRLVRATNRYFGAERGALFWFDLTGSRPPQLRAGCNLTETDVAADTFRSNLALVFKAFRENRVQTAKIGKKGGWPYKEKAILCLPFSLKGYPRGVLYHDNSYLNDCFNFLEETELNRLIRSLSSYIEYAHNYKRRLEKLSFENLGQAPISDAAAEIVGDSAPIRKLLAQTDQIAATKSSVLILGETGVGKELVARRIHERSDRRDNPLVVVDPTAVPENLVESELFGHEKGAFTGADRQRRGRIELAHRGTLFIDEVGEIPKSIQVKLLRALQEKTVVRLGGNTPIFSDFRLIAATNRDLAKAVAEGRFREDLYYRLNVIPIKVPPLRDRQGDLGLLARHFIKRYTTRYNRPHMLLLPEDEAALTAYAWPGNVREFQNVMERSILLSQGDQLELDLPPVRRAMPDHPFADMPSLDEVQRRYIAFVMEKSGGKISGPGGAAEVLGMKRTSLYNRMRKLEMR